MRILTLRYLLLTFMGFLCAELVGQTSIEGLRAIMYSKNASAAQSIQNNQSKRDSLYFNPSSNIEELALDQLKKTIDAKAKLYSFNGEVLVSQNGRILSYASFGFANPLQREKLETGYRFQLASVSKQFTAVAILELVAKGKLRLDDSFSQYFPTFKFNDITIEQLLTHASGLPDYFWYLENTWKSNSGPKNEDIYRA